MADNWGMQNIEAALTEVAGSTKPDVTNGPEVAADASVKNPQDHGWVKETPYDYANFNMSNKEAFDASAGAVTAGAEPDSADFMGVESGNWASNAAIYEWNDEYGDVGPRVEGLEKLLFGGEHQMKTGIQFETITALQVTQEGTIHLEPARKFEEAGLHPVMLENIRLAGYKVPTPIQQYCLPAVAKGYDIVACAQTGSGKTAAFIVPVLSKLMGKAKKLTAPRPNPATYIAGVTPPVRAEPLVLILVPTRELATQIFNEARKFCYRSMLRPAVIYGGAPVGEHQASLAKGCDVLIATPGRLVDFINRPHILTLRRLKYMILDEADELLQPDWEGMLAQILSGGDQEEGNIKYMMFSATFPRQLRDLARDHLSHDHVRIRVGRAGSSHMNIQQEIVFVEANMKRTALEDLLLSAPPARTIIFVNSKRTADELDDHLFNKHFPCVSIHADRTQREREDCIRAFRSGKMPILIATGVSARGLDIFNVMHVINYDLPSHQHGGIEEYTHRIGRTGRIGNMGLATSFYNDRDADLASALTKTLLETRQAVPDFLEEHIPEGFNATQGDITTLHFDADTDDEEENATGEADGGAEAGGWGASAAGWGGGGTQNETTDATGWVAPAPAAVPQVANDTPQPAASGWGAPAPAAPVPQIIQAAPHTAPAVTGWGAPAPAAPVHQSTQATQPAPGPAASGWGAPAHAAPIPQFDHAAPQDAPIPAAVAPPVHQTPAATGWGGPSYAPLVQQTSAASGWGGPAPAPSIAKYVQAAPQPTPTRPNTTPSAHPPPPPADNGWGGAWNSTANVGW